jgi:hypothetical protein
LDTQKMKFCSLHKSYLAYLGHPKSQSRLV